MVESARLREALEALERKAGYHRMLEQRASLPAYGLRDDIVKVGGKMEALEDQ